MKDNIDKIFDNFLEKQEIEAPVDFYENLMGKINSQDDVIENNFDSFLNKKISSNLSYEAIISSKTKKFKFSKLTKYAACLIGAFLICASTYMLENTNKSSNINKSNDIDLYANAIFFSNESLADISEVSSQNALDMLNYLASTSL